MIIIVISKYNHHTSIWYAECIRLVKFVLMVHGTIYHFPTKDSFGNGKVCCHLYVTVMARGAMHLLWLGGNNVLFLFLNSVLLCPIVSVVLCNYALTVLTCLYTGEYNLQCWHILYTGEYNLQLRCWHVCTLGNTTYSVDTFCTLGNTTYSVDMFVHWGIQLTVLTCLYTGEYNLQCWHVCTLGNTTYSVDTFVHWGIQLAFPL